MAGLRQSERPVVRFWDAATGTSFLFIVAVFSVIHISRPPRDRFSYRRVPRWLIRFLGGDDIKKQVGNLACDMLYQGVLPPLNHLLCDLLA
jgi:hypothetical protein